MGFSIGPTGSAYIDPVVPVHYNTIVVRDIADLATAMLAVRALNCYATMSAYVYDNDTRSISLCSSAYLHTENLSWRRVVRAAALLQDIDAHARAPELATANGGRPAVLPHPTRGFREEMDDLPTFVN